MLSPARSHGVLGRGEIGKKSAGQGEECMRGMKYNPEKHRRRSIRVQGYDYSQPGWYFVTIVTHDRQNLFGRIENGKMILNDGGKIVRKCWLEIPDHYPNVNLDEFIVMPNHIHGIIDIAGVQNFVGVQNFEPLQRRRNKYQKIIPKSIGAITRGFKIGVTKWFRQNTDIHTVWQRNYWEHIIRNDTELYRIRNYIITNPQNWHKDRYHI